MPYLDLKTHILEFIDTEDLKDEQSAKFTLLEYLEDREGAELEGLYGDDGAEVIRHFLDIESVCLEAEIKVIRKAIDDGSGILQENPRPGEYLKRTSVDQDVHDEVDADRELDR